MRNTVIFDLGGVLIDWNPRYLYRKLMPDEASIEHFLANVATGEWNAQQDAGRPFTEGVAILSEQFPDQADLISAFHTRWIEMIGGAIEDTVTIMQELRDANVPLYALTNWSAETFPLVRPTFDFLDWFIGIVVSGEEKMIKPDAAFYNVLFDRYNLDPADTVFIDDSLANIKTARELGVHAIHFNSPAQVRKDLVEVGLLT